MEKMARASYSSGKDDETTTEERGCLEKTKLDTCEYLCVGDAWWLYNVLCFPFVLIWRAFWIYLCGCIGVLFRRFFRTVFCSCAKVCCPSWYRYTDKTFSPDKSSIYNHLDEVDKDFDKAGADLVEWVRADEIVKDRAREQRAKRPRSHTSTASSGSAAQDEDEPTHAYLFEDGIRPDDIAQGGVGDCWLLAALACMAEYPDAVRNIFETKEHSSRGKYVVRLYSDQKQRMVDVTVDDFVPVKAGTLTPYFSQPKGNELWVFLVEKAFAKLVGGYAYLHGGRSLWAWHVLTGDNVFGYELASDKKTWERYLYKFEYRDKKMFQNHRMHKEDTHERNDHTRMFRLLCHFSKQRALMTASIHSEEAATNGLVKSHAYSLIDAKEVNGFRLVNLRNPWGIGEWKGDWSDQSSLWTSNPKVARYCRNLDRDQFDGSFWMSFDDFVRHYDRVEVCDRSAFNDLQLDVKEDDGCWGVVKGCGLGCFRYWFCCAGVRMTYCAHRTTEDVKYSAGPCGCMKDTGRAWVDSDHVV
eukprot:m.61457 g.61457  ORF g.61457 m.61457 type:complete len:526 (+) comp11866_c2_seq1:66-1643(+)